MAGAMLAPEGPKITGLRRANGESARSRCRHRPKGPLSWSISRQTIRFQLPANVVPTRRFLAKARAARPGPRGVLRAWRRRLAAAVVGLVLAAAATAQQSDLSTVDTRLFEAVFANNMSAVRAAVADGADVMRRDGDGLTAADLAVDKGYFEIAHFLLSVRNFRQREGRAAAKPDAVAAPPPPPAAPAPAGGSASPLPEEAPNQPTADALLGSITRRGPDDAAPVATPPAAPPSPPPPPRSAEVAPRPLPKGVPNPFDPTSVAPGSAGPDSGATSSPPAPPAPTPAAPTPAAAARPASATPRAVPGTPPPPATAPAETVPDDGPQDRPLSGFLDRLAGFFGTSDDEAPHQSTTPAAPDAPKTHGDEPPEPGRGGFLDRLAGLFTDDATTASAPPAGTPSGTAAPQAPATRQAAPPDSRQAAARVEEDAAGAPAPAATPSPAPTSDTAPPTQEPGGEGAEETARDAEPIRAADPDQAAPPPGATPDGPAAKPLAGLLDRLKGLFGGDDDAPAAEGDPGKSARATAEDAPPPPADPPAAADGATKSPRATAEDVPPAPADAPMAADGNPASPSPADAPAAAPDKPGFFGQVVDFFRTAPRRPEDPAEAPPAAAPADAPAEAPAGPAKEVPAEQARRASDPADTAAPARHGVGADGLRLGASLVLGHKLDAEHPPAMDCIQKRSWNAVFCVESVDWPDAIRPVFMVRSPLYKGAKAIVRYDGGIATRFHAIYPSVAFDEVVGHLTRQFGEPSETPRLRMVMIGEPPRVNPTARWIGVDAKGREAAVLEVRTYDDTRGTLPDTLFGMIRLYRVGTTPIFRHLSTADLLLLNMRRIRESGAADPQVAMPPPLPNVAKADSEVAVPPPAPDVAQADAEVAVPPPPEGAEDDGGSTGFWKRLADFVRTGTPAEEAPAAAATTAPAREAPSRSETVRPVAPADPWAPKVTILARPAGRPAVDAVVSAEAPAEPDLPAPTATKEAPAGTESEAAADADREEAVAKKTPTGTARDQVVAEKAPAAPVAGAERSVEPEAAADRPRFGIALPGRAFFEKLAEFLRPGDEAPKDKATAEATPQPAPAPEKEPPAAAAVPDGEAAADQAAAGEAAPDDAAAGPETAPPAAMADAMGTAEALAADHAPAPTVAASKPRPEAPAEPPPGAVESAELRPEEAASQAAEVAAPGDEERGGESPASADEAAAAKAGEDTDAELESEPEAPAEKPGTFTRLLGKWAEFFGPAERRPKSAVTVSQEIEPAPSRGGAQAAETEGEALSAEAAETAAWSVRDIDIAEISPPVVGERLRAFPPRKTLNNVRLTIGKSLRLGRIPRRRRDDPNYRERCVRKKRGTVAFCVVPVDWPEDLIEHFQVSSVMYDGAKAIARYDDERATYFHTLFNSSGFDAVIDHYRKRYGGPTESWARRMVVMASPPRPNPTLLWRSVGPSTNLTTTLEVRKYDDARGGFPDTKRGVVLLYHTWSSPIFPEISSLELMTAK